MYNITILWDLQINPLIRTRVLSTPSIQSIASMLDLVDSSSFATADSFLKAILIICENLILNPRALSILVQPVVSLLVPVLFHKLSNSTEADIKILSFKIYADIMQHLIQDSKDLRQDPSNIEAMELLDSHIKTLLTGMLEILSRPDSFDPIPTIGLRLVASIIDQFGISTSFNQFFMKNGKN